MLEMFIYPVSGVMRLWHYIFADLFGCSQSQAWVASLFALVVTVRSIIAPFSWMQFKSGRFAIMMRPKIKRLKEEYAERTDKESILEQERRQKEIQEEYGYSMAAGCVPALIQVPVFLGLYQVLLRMARPKEGLDATVHEPIGLLTSDNVRSFLETRFFGVPLPAYNSMSPEQLARLGTDQPTIHAFVLPLIIAACVFTTINMIVSTLRTRYSIDHDSEFAVGMYRFLIAMVLVAPIGLLQTGIFGPIPAAICLYWVANNLWTLIQNNGMFLALWWKYPYDSDHKAFQAERRAQRAERVVVKKARKKALRRLRNRSLVQPWKIAALRQQARDIKNEVREEKEAEKARKKAIREKRREAQNEINDEKNAERIEKIARRVAKYKEKKAAKKGLDPKSNNQQEEQTTTEPQDPEQSSTTPPSDSDDTPQDHHPEKPSTD
ncbi:membrane protein insertase YidC [Corynebacterium diphtheriae]|nr:membrane protein insertase YidC [Corynebacterium diphtheriae]CAB0764469.1 membrane protein insertase YidC [Corynebacterium diphtheriae]